MSLYNFTGKTVIITGASQGIGAKVAQEFIKLKANVVLNARNPQQLEEAKAKCIELGASNGQIVLVAGDITKDEVQKAVIDGAINNFGSIDILVNNAGTTDSIVPWKLKMSTFDEVLNLNLRAPVALCLLALPHLFKSKGNIVNVSSLASLRPLTSRLSYSSSKAGLDMFTKSLAFNIARFGVRVNSVNPALIKTDFAKDMLANNEAAKARMKNVIANIHPMGRTGTVEEVANAILFLASDKASFTTGQIFVVDGGAAMGGVAPDINMLAKL